MGIVFPGCSPCDRLRANGSALRGSSSLAVRPSTGSGRTEAHFGDRLPWLCALRRAQGEWIAHFGDRLSRQFTLRQAQGERIAHFGDRLPGLCTLRRAQGERKCNLGIVFPGCAPFDRLRANGSAIWGSSSPAVHPATGSGRTEVQFGDRLPRLCALRQAQGERKRTLGIVFPGCSPFDRLRANGLRP